jgi:hypothetical protein
LKGIEKEASKMQNRYELYETLKPIENLYNQAQALLAWEPKAMEEIGLINAEERAILDTAKQAEAEITKAEYEAEEALPPPDLKGVYPAEFAELLERKERLAPQYNRMEKVTLIIFNLTPSTGYFQNSIADFVGVGLLAGHLADKLRDLPDGVYAELREVERAIENKSRSNSRVAKIRGELWAERGRLVIKAKADAHSKVAGQYADVLNKRDRLNHVIASRRQEKLAPIKEQIEQILEKAIKELEE